MCKTPLVSILCATYNQKDYIAQAIEGFLMQKVNFPIEIIIHDDASTDGTAEIVKQYAEKHPDLIKAILQTENQYSKKNGIWTNFIYPNARGKYFADCEGDDYWTDPNKLQRQVDFLESHSDYSLSTENANVLFTNTGVVRPFSNEPERDISLDELLIQRKFPTASVVYRSEYLQEFLQSDQPSFDTATWAYLSTKGKIHFNPVISSIYRRGCGVTENNKIKWAYTSERFNKEINKFYKPSKKVHKARTRTLYFDLKSGWKTAKQQKKSKDAKKLFFKMLYKSPILFIKDLIHSKGKRKFLECKTYFWNFYYKLVPAKKLKINSNLKIPVVVSLTSYPARFGTLHLCLKSLLNQSMQPSKIVLYLDKPVSLESLPTKILKLQKKGLTIRCICENIKPHNKYFYAMQEYPNAAIITVDDDMIYPRDVISSLYNSFLKNPTAVSARRIHQISHGLDGQSTPYNTWKIEAQNLTTGDRNAFATGVGGILYPPGIFDFSQPYLQTAAIVQHCQTADDIWLAFIERVNSIPICYVPNKQAHPYQIIDQNLANTALRNQNVFAGQNDIFIQKCKDFFNIDL